ncbi:MAG: EamA family transporter, partial [Alphaproteobacteria bacterium]
MFKQRGRDSSHFTGVVLVVISAVVFSTSGAFTKGVHAGAWEIVFWRSVFAAGFTSVYEIWRGSFKRELVRMGASGWAVAPIGASGSAAFIPAFKLTTMANVMLIYAAAPLLAAILAWLWIRERMTRRVALECVGAIVGVGIIVQGSFGTGDLRGDLLSLWMTMVMATVMVIYRRFPHTPAAGPA